MVAKEESSTSNVTINRSKRYFCIFFHFRLLYSFKEFLHLDFRDYSFFLQTSFFCRWDWQSAVWAVGGWARSIPEAQDGVPPGVRRDQGQAGRQDPRHGRHQQTTGTPRVGQGHRHGCHEQTTGTPRVGQGHRHGCHQQTTGTPRVGQGTCHGWHQQTPGRPRIGQGTHWCH